MAIDLYIDMCLEMCTVKTTDMYIPLIEVGMSIDICLEMCDRHVDLSMHMPERMRAHISILCAHMAAQCERSIRPWPSRAHILVMAY